LLRLSKNFTLAELTKSSTALRKGIDNTPSKEEITKLEYLTVKLLQPIRDEFGSYSVSSAFRCLELNREIGSKDSSQHALAEAADLEVAGVDNFVLACWIRDNLEFDQLILEFYDGTPSSGWVHVSISETKRNRGECLTINKGNVHRGLIGKH
jgi:hypothetical protein